MVNKMESGHIGLRVVKRVQKVTIRMVSKMESGLNGMRMVKRN